MCVLLCSVKNCIRRDWGKVKSLYFSEDDVYICFLLMRSVHYSVTAGKAAACFWLLGVLKYAAFLCGLWQSLHTHVKRAALWVKKSSCLCDTSKELSASHGWECVWKYWQTLLEAEWGLMIFWGLWSRCASPEEAVLQPVLLGDDGKARSQWSHFPMAFPKANSYVQCRNRAHGL